MNEISSLLTRFLEELDQLVEHGTNTKETVCAVRQTLTCALKDPGFGLACIERVLDGLDPGNLGWQHPDIHCNPSLGYSICVFHWPPGFANAPHRHDTWTVTGVLHNGLRFNTYRHDATQSALIPEKRIDAKSGDVGYICTPCIHNVENPSATQSLSIHIFSHPQTAGTAVELVEYPMEGTIPQSRDQASAALSGAVREYVLASCVEMIGAHMHPNSLPLLDRILDLARARTRLVAVKAMVAIDPLHAAGRARALAERVGGKFEHQLRQASDAILGYA